MPVNNLNLVRQSHYQRMYGQHLPVVIISKLRDAYLFSKSEKKTPLLVFLEKRYKRVVFKQRPIFLSFQRDTLKQASNDMKCKTVKTRRFHFLLFSELFVLAVMIVVAFFHFVLMMRVSIKSEQKQI